MCNLCSCDVLHPEHPALLMQGKRTRLLTLFMWRLFILCEFQVVWVCVVCELSFHCFYFILFVCSWLCCAASSLTQLPSVLWHSWSATKNSIWHVKFHSTDFLGRSFCYHRPTKLDIGSSCCDRSALVIPDAVQTWWYVLSDELHRLGYICFGHVTDQNKCWIALTTETILTTCLASL